MKYASYTNNYIRPTTTAAAKILSSYYLMTK